ncbi:MAG: SurA N-terminal domain-containing protein [Spirochaetaceae bacterium]|nr:MAG: SurA N-terminal domain-containing protein [Spirochaetaceae bacterium]
MKRIKDYLTSKIVRFVVLLLSVAILLGIFKIGYDGFRSVDRRTRDSTPAIAAGLSTAQFAKAELSVQGLSCSSCIQDIETALAGIEGIGEVLVDISRGRAQVYFDPQRIVNSDIIAEEISNAGYPAAVMREFDPQEVAAELAFAEEQTRYYVVSVGGFKVARADFTTELSAVRLQYRKLYGEEVFAGANGEILEDNLKLQCLNRLISEAVMLQEVSRAGQALTKNVDLEFEGYLQQNGQDLETFKAALQEFGYPFEYFKKKFENQILIQEYLENTVMKSATTPFQQQTLYDQWYRNAQSLAEVVYFDKELERVAQNASAGSSCCE